MFSLAQALRPSGAKEIGAVCTRNALRSGDGTFSLSELRASRQTRRDHVSFLRRRTWSRGHGRRHGIRPCDNPARDASAHVVRCRRPRHGLRSTRPDDHLWWAAAAGTDRYGNHGTRCEHRARHGPGRDVRCPGAQRHGASHGSEEALGASGLAPRSNVGESLGRGAGRNCSGKCRVHTVRQVFPQLCLIRRRCGRGLGTLGPIALARTYAAAHHHGRPSPPLPLVGVIHL